MDRSNLYMRPVFRSEEMSVKVKSKVLLYLILTLKHLRRLQFHERYRRLTKVSLYVIRRYKSSNLSSLSKHRNHCSINISGKFIYVKKICIASSAHPPKRSFCLKLEQHGQECKAKPRTSSPLLPSCLNNVHTALIIQ